MRSRRSRTLSRSPLTYSSPTRCTYRAHCRAGPSFSLPTARRSFFCASLSVSGTPSENNRAVVESRTPSCPSLFPAMSTLTMAITSRPSPFRRVARCCEPINPCSSPATATR